MYAYGQTAILAGSETPLIVSGLVMQFFLFGMWAVLYAYTPELYSTGARATGSGFASAVGRDRCWARTWWEWCCRTGEQGGVFTVGAGCFFVAALLSVLGARHLAGRTVGAPARAVRAGGERAAH